MKSSDITSSMVLRTKRPSVAARKAASTAVGRMRYCTALHAACQLPVMRPSRMAKPVMGCMTI
ncbi:hypothetical protein D3C72_2511550 [compost metagenome]